MPRVAEVLEFSSIGTDSRTLARKQARDVREGCFGKETFSKDPVSDVYIPTPRLVTPAAGLGKRTYIIVSSK